MSQEGNGNKSQGQDDATPDQARKTKATLSKQPPKEKNAYQDPHAFSKPEADSPTPPHSPFAYSPSGPQEKHVHFSDEDKNEQVFENDFGDHSSATSEEEPILE
ncbi:hypothetical protein DSO57_1018600 [Entomophthora muscae]|uniref:Uncharacterized protein n=1 Tax=Entomophthora muscae TaxID=34485 RepID=A0ACC2RIV1_9FUNG|nr:hypothetical protein DSO57_1018600 [Entomophthora muscae]